MELTSVLGLAAALLLLIYAYFSYRFSYWRKRGVPYPEPLPIVGNAIDLILNRRSFFKVIRDYAEQFREHGYCGIYQWGTPILLVWEPEMVKQIVTKDFSSFHDRGLPYDEKSDPLSAHLFNLDGTRWRNLRNKLSPTFTSGKMKLMFNLMTGVGQQLSVALAQEAKEAPQHEVDVSELLNRYATDLIGTCAFGIDCNCLQDGNNQFLRMSRGLFRTSFGQTLRFLLQSVHPKLANLVPFKLLFNQVHAFFLKLMKDTVEFREKNHVDRTDFVQLMMQLREADRLQTDRVNFIDFTPGVMAAQAFIFFIAGLDNVSNTISYSMSRLAADPDLQERVARQVHDVLKASDGQLTYDALKKMDLVEGVVREGLRTWSPVGLLIRKCNEDTRVGDLQVEKGQGVMIVVDNLHSDPNLFPEPERFIPERHDAETRASRHPYAYLPFGEGPRMCIAERFAILEMKVAVAVLLRDFVFSPGPNYEKEPEQDTSSFFPRPKNGFKLCVAPRVS